MKTAALIFGMAAVATALPVPAQAPASNTETLGRQLADLLDPADKIVADSGRIFREIMEETAPQEPKFASIARKRPKEFESVLDAGQSAEAAILRREYPAGQRRIAAMFDRKLSIADLNALLAHFRSPLGRKLIAQGYSSIDREGMENPARFGLDRFFTRKERQQMAAFAKTSAARDFEAANLERHKIRIGWAQSLKSEIERDGNAGMDAALAQYNAHSGSAR